MNRLLLFILTIGYTIVLNGQEKSREELYYNKVKQFYTLLNTDNVTLKETYNLFGEYTLEIEEYLFFEECLSSECESEFSERIQNPSKYSSVFFENIKKIRNVFTDNNQLSLDSIIFNSKLYDEGLPSSIAIDVKFSEELIVYFYLNKYADERVYITNIYLSNGASFYNEILKKAEGVEATYLYRFGVINDPDGYTNVRDGKSSGSPIVAKFMSDEIFQFTPNNYSNWWHVRNADRSIEGFMHKSRITPFGNLPDTKKKELIQR